MTAQIPDSLDWNGERWCMYSEPLAQYFKMTGDRPVFRFAGTAHLRGYFAEWKIVGGELYLADLNSRLRDGSEFKLIDLFPDEPGNVFARWFTGIIRLPIGELVRYVHLPYASQYEAEFLLQFERGVLVREERKEHDVLMAEWELARRKSRLNAVLNFMRRLWPTRERG